MTARDTPHLEGYFSPQYHQAPCRFHNLPRRFHVLECKFPFHSESSWFHHKPKMVQRKISFASLNRSTLIHS